MTQDLGRGQAACAPIFNPDNYSAHADLLTAGSVYTGWKGNAFGIADFVILKYGHKCLIGFSHPKPPLLAMKSLDRESA